jgi:hypothetical protein
LFAQTETAALVVKDSKSNDIDPLTPAKAAFTLLFYLVLGQAYKKYWKIPLVYVALLVFILY